MNRGWSSYLLFVLCASFVAQPLAAQAPSGFYVSPYIGITFPQGTIGVDLGATFPAWDLDPAPMLGTNLGYRLKNGLAFEGLLVYTPGKMSNKPEDFAPVQAAFDLNSWRYGVSLAYFFWKDKTSVVPFVTGGAGGVSMSTAIDEPNMTPSTTELYVNLGVGLEVPITEKALIRFTLMDYFTSTSWEPLLPEDLQPDESSAVHFISLLAGMTFYF
jgi:hypothetical protein